MTSDGNIYSAGQTVTVNGITFVFSYNTSGYVVSCKTSVKGIWVIVNGLLTDPALNYITVVSANTNTTLYSNLTYSKMVFMPT